MKRGSPGRWVSGFGEMGYVTFLGMLLDEGEGRSCDLAVG